MPRVGVWLTNSPSPLYYDAGLLDRAVHELAEAGFNTLYPNVWSRGTTFHASRWAPMEPALRQANGGLDPICRLTQAAHRRGLQVIPWFEYGLMEPADAEVVKQHPEWVLQKRDGTSLTTMHGRNDRVWLNPAHPGVRQRFIGLISEIVQRCGVDGIQLDDHFAWPVELGYDAFSRELYTKDTGLQPPDNYTDRAWMTWRRHRLTDLLAELRDSLKQAGKGRVYVSLSPGPFRFAYNNWLQDWEIWALGGQIEELVVQNYAYSLPGFTKDLDQPALLKARTWGIPVEIGILAGFGGRTSSLPMLRDQVQKVSERGMGVIFFYWEGLWGQYSGPEGAPLRRAGFRQINGLGGSVIGPGELPFLPR
jgi:uncharacterized lipoprotein YddW (UPF0748 family)